MGKKQENKQPQIAPRYTVFVPENHDVLIKVIPEEDFSKRAASPLFLEEEAKIRATTREEMERQYSEMVDSFGALIPDKSLMSIGRKYMEARGQVGRLEVKDGYMHVSAGGRKPELVGLFQALVLLRSQPKTKVKASSGKVVRRIGDVHVEWPSIPLS
jgi:hypothetical protein